MEFSSINLRRWFLGLFALALLGINIAAYVFFQKNEEVAASHQWVTHTYKVLALTSDMFVKLEDAQTAQRGYLIVPDSMFLSNYRTFSSQLDALFDEIKSATVDNLGRQAMLTNFKAQLDEQRILLEQEIVDKQHGKNASLDDMANNARHLEAMRTTYKAMIDNEVWLLDLRLAAEKQKQTAYMRGIFAASGFSIFGLLLANGLIIFLSLRRQAAEDNLLRINREMEGFTYIASHDLRSPLVNLKGFASEMRYGLDEVQPIVDRAMENAPEEERKKAFAVLHQDIPEALGYIHSSVEKMDKLTNAILELSRIGRRTLRLENVDTDKVVRHVLDTLHHQIEVGKIQVRVQSLPVVLADQLSIEQIFGNIIDNAIKYLDPQRPGRLEIGANRNYRETVFWVKDNGRGISEHDQQKIFEIYRRGGGIQDIAGEGMGMAYVRATLRRLDGAIWFESTPGAGTTFFFSVSNTLTKKEA